MEKPHFLAPIGKFLLGFLHAWLIAPSTFGGSGADLVGTSFGGVVGAILVDRAVHGRFNKKTLCKCGNVLGGRIFFIVTGHFGDELPRKLDRVCNLLGFQVGTSQFNLVCVDGVLEE